MSLTGATIITQNFEYNGTIIKPGISKGSIIANNGSYFDVFAIGATGTILTSDSTQSLGLSWSTLTAGVGFSASCSAISVTGGFSYTVSDDSSPSIFNIASTANSLTSGMFHTSPFRLGYTGTDTKIFYVSGRANANSSVDLVIYIAKNGTAIDDTFNIHAGVKTSPYTFGLVSLSQNDYVELFLGRVSGAGNTSFYGGMLEAMSID